MTLRLQVEDCRGCGRRRKYLCYDVRPGGVAFACERCRYKLYLRLEQLVVLAKRDRARLHLAPIRFLIEGRLAAGFANLDVPVGVQLRLHLSGPWSCGCRQDFWLKDVYESGPLFCCPEDPEHEWHLHLDQLRTLALADRLALGGPVPSHLFADAPLLEPVDRRAEEALGALREESLRRGYQPRELPWRG
jgi:hypothetical protein